MNNPLFNYNVIARVTPTNPNFVQLEVTFSKKTNIIRCFCKEVTVWLPFQEETAITAFSGFKRWQIGNGELVDSPVKDNSFKVLRYIINDNPGEPLFDEKKFGFGFKIDKTVFNNLPNLTLFVQENSKLEGEPGFSSKEIQKTVSGIVDASVRIDYFIAIDNEDKPITNFSRKEGFKLTWDGSNIDTDKLSLFYNGEEHNAVQNPHPINAGNISNDTTFILKAKGDKLNDETYKTLNVTIKDPVLNKLLITDNPIDSTADLHVNGKTRVEGNLNVVGSIFANEFGIHDDYKIVIKVGKNKEGIEIQSKTGQTLKLNPESNDVEIGKAGSNNTIKGHLHVEGGTTMAQDINVKE